MHNTSSQPILSVSGVSKVYVNGFTALRNVSLDVRRGEIFALLGPNGAGKTTLINLIAGAVRLERGTITVCGHDVVRDARAARRCIGLVPQEMPLEIFTPVERAVRYQRGFHGLPQDDALVEKTLRDLSLWDKRHNEIRTLSGGMKRRVMIAMALITEPRVLFLDEPTAGVDVALRRDLWRLVRTLRAQGTTIILTTHYLEEAEEMADRVGIITKGRLLLTEDKNALLQRLGTTQITITLAAPLATLPERITHDSIRRSDDHTTLHITATPDAPALDTILRTLHDAGATITGITTTRTSLEDIFVRLTDQTTTA